MRYALCLFQTRVNNGSLSMTAAECQLYNLQSFSWLFCTHLKCIEVQIQRLIQDPCKNNTKRNDEDGNLQ